MPRSSVVVLVYCKICFGAPPPRPQGTDAAVTVSHRVLPQSSFLKSRVKPTSPRRRPPAISPASAGSSALSRRPPRAPLRLRQLPLSATVPPRIPLVATSPRCRPPHRPPPAVPRAYTGSAHGPFCDPLRPPPATLPHLPPATSPALFPIEDL